MPRGGGRNSGGENIQHFSHLRLRVNGQGNLLGNLISLDDVRSSPVPTTVMASSTNIEPTRLVNFVEQRARYELYTDEINEWFRINRIIIYLKDYGSEYPM